MLYYLNLLELSGLTLSNLYSMQIFKENTPKVVKETIKGLQVKNFRFTS